jgi:hypothetical protein
MTRGFSRAKQVDITVRNKLIKEKRDINVYHHSDRSAHIVSCNSSITRSIKPVEADDYLHISVVTGPGILKDYCVLDLPSFVNFRFSLPGEMTLIHSGERILVRIPPGPPLWEVKMTLPKRLSTTGSIADDHVTVTDDEEWPE